MGCPKPHSSASGFSIRGPQTWHTGRGRVTWFVLLMGLLALGASCGDDGGSKSGRTAEVPEATTAGAATAEVPTPTDRSASGARPASPPGAMSPGQYANLSYGYIALVPLGWSMLQRGDELWETTSNDGSTTFSVWAEPGVGTSVEEFHSSTALDLINRSASDFEISPVDMGVTESNSTYDLPFLFADVRTLNFVGQIRTVVSDDFGFVFLATFSAESDQLSYDQAASMFDSIMRSLP